MPTVHSYGEVLPRPFRVSISIPEITWEIPEKNISLRFVLEIKDSKVHVTVHASKYFASDMDAIYVRVWDLVRASVELVAFREGWGIEVIFSKFVGPDG